MAEALPDAEGNAEDGEGEGRTENLATPSWKPLRARSKLLYLPIPIPAATTQRVLKNPRGPTEMTPDS